GNAARGAAIVRSINESLRIGWVVAAYPAVVPAKAGTHNHREMLLEFAGAPTVAKLRAVVMGSGFRRNDSQFKFTLNSYARSPPTSVSFSEAPSGVAPGGRPSSSKMKRFTPGGPCSSSFGIGSAQSGVGPSTNRLTSLESGALTSTSTLLSPSRLISRIVIGAGSPIFTGFGTASSAAARLPSSVLAPLPKGSS